MQLTLTQPEITIRLFVTVTRLKSFIVRVTDIEMVTLPFDTKFDVIKILRPR